MTCRHVFLADAWGITSANSTAHIDAVDASPGVLLTPAAFELLPQASCSGDVLKALDQTVGLEASSVYWEYCCGLSCQPCHTASWSSWAFTHIEWAMCCCYTAGGRTRLPSRCPSLRCLRVVYLRCLWTAGVADFLRLRQVLSKNGAY